MAGFRLCVEPGFNIDTFVYLFLKFPFGVVLPFVVGLILHSQTSIQQPWPFISIFPSFYLVAKISQWVTAAPPLAKEIDWKSSVVVLTGGSHGVGYSLARQMLGHGATVVVLDIQPFRLHSPFHNLKNRIKYYRVDLGNKNDVKSVCKKVKEEVGQPNVLVCNAGTVSLKNLLDQTDDDIER
ncbi:hypothetical protein H4219_002475 [Mycoemilia scoparia]|uniref:Uncharacterized protein n=1 Tax=Mycoemilia scoparia TaxID=417184 RepID=A0A9W8DQJ4_9FUNG|nr:hypothetical protein H4219_002475 [Mycoemilia scoparia]